MYRLHSALRATRPQLWLRLLHSCGAIRAVHLETGGAARQPASSACDASGGATTGWPWSSDDDKPLLDSLRIIVPPSWASKCAKLSSHLAATSAQPAELTLRGWADGWRGIECWLCTPWSAGLRRNTAFRRNPLLSRVVPERPPSAGTSSQQDGGFT